MASLGICGGTVVTADGAAGADILVEDDKIVEIAAPGRLNAVDQTLDAGGCVVMPGAIDIHTHLDHQVAPDLRTADDFHTGTAAAAAGGTTTIVDFAPAHGETSLVEALERRLDAASGRAVVDYSFHAAITATGLSHGPDDLRAVAAAGATTFKVYMAYPGRMMSDDSTLLEVMSLAADLGCLVLVHAENGHMILHRTRALMDAGDTAEHMHLAAHPEESEVEAVRRVIALAGFTGCDLLILHVSSSLAAREIATTRSQGQSVWGETCPQYLFASYEDYSDLGFEAAKYICSPPIRERAHQATLWALLASDGLSTFGSDHAPFHLHAEPGKSRGKGDFSKIPNGVPGIEDRVKLLLEFGVGGGRMSLARLVEVVSTQPAKLAGLYPRKGAITVGADADLVVWDPERPYLISAETQHMNVDYNLYEGMRVSWSPRVVMSRGEVIVKDGDVTAKPGRGHFIARAPFRHASSE